MSASPAKSDAEEEDASSSSIALPLNQLLLFRNFFLLVTTTIGASKILSSTPSSITFILSSSPSSSLYASLFPLLPLCNIKLSSNARLASGFKIAISSSSIALRISTFSITYVSIGGNCLASSRPIEDKIRFPFESTIGRNCAVFTSIFAIVQTNLRLSALKNDDPPLVVK